MNNSTDTIYSNIKVYYENELIFICGRKKAKWYLKNNLAVDVDGDLHLNFKPKGTNYKKILRDNICVVCGIDYNLTKHHVIPYCYRRHYGIKYDSFDILSMCRKCHDVYETEAMKLKNELQLKYNERAYMYNSVKMKSIAIKLLNDNLKKYQRILLIIELKKLSNKNTISKRYINMLSRLDINPDSKHFMFGFTVASSIKYSEMANIWRKHFITTMECDYIPLDYMDMLRSLSL